MFSLIITTHIDVSKILIEQSFVNGYFHMNEYNSSRKQSYHDGKFFMNSAYLSDGACSDVIERKLSSTQEKRKEARG